MTITGMIFIRTVVFLFLPYACHALITDEILRNFCLGPILDYPGGLTASERVGDEQCTQEVPVTAKTMAERIRICRTYGLFQVHGSEPTSDNKRTRCVWGQKYRCRAGEKTIDHDCLSQTPYMSFTELKDHCRAKQLSVYSVGDRIQARWLLRLIHRDGTNVWVGNDVDKSKLFFPKNREMGYSRSNYDYGKNYRQVSIVGSPDWEIGVYAGMLIPTQKDERLTGYCSRPAMRAPSPPGSSDPSGIDNGTNHMVFPISGSLTAFLSTPFAFSHVERKAITLDLEEMASHCRRQGRDAFPLSPTEEILTKIREYISHPVYMYMHMHDPAEYINDCSITEDRSVTMKQLFGTLDANKKLQLVPKEFWLNGWPKPMCARHSPVAVVSNSHGKLQNFPSNARLPVLCGRGVPPVLPIEQICQNPNSVPIGGGKCKCKDGTVDGSIRHPNYPPGRYCISPEPCTELRTDLYFYIIVDESTSINTVYWPNGAVRENKDNWNLNVVPFVKNLVNGIQGSFIKRGGIIRFSNPPNIIAQYVSPWQPEVLKRFIDTPHVGGYTYLGAAIDNLITHLHTYERRGNFKLVTLIATDGQPNDGAYQQYINGYLQGSDGSTEPALRKAEELKRFPHSSVIVFRIGLANDTVSNYIASSPDNFIREHDISKINEAIGDLLTLVCPPPDYSQMPNEPG